MELTLSERVHVRIRPGMGVALWDRSNLLGIAFVGGKGAIPAEVWGRRKEDQELEKVLETFFNVYSAEQLEKKVDDGLIYISQGVIDKNYR